MLTLSALEEIISSFVDIVMKNHPDLDKFDLAYMMEEIANQIKEGRCPSCGQHKPAHKPNEC